MKYLFARFLIFILKKIDIDLMPHACIQNGFGCTEFSTSGEENLLKYIKNKITIYNAFDVGANNGGYTNILLKYFKKAKIYSFEPMHNSFEAAENNIIEKSRTTLSKLALGSRIGTLKLYNDLKNPCDKMSTSYPKGLSFFGMKNLVAFQVPLNTLDNYSREMNIKNIDFLKLDVEGAEYEVLKGAKEMIKEGRISFVQFEFNCFNLISGVYLKDFYEILPDYRFYRISNHKLHYMGKYNPDNENFRQQNLLAISNNQFLNFPSENIHI